MPARGAGAAARTVWGTCIRRAATHAMREGHTHWHRVWRGYMGPWGSRNPLQKSSSHLSPGKRCEATAQSALGWYRPSVGVPETFSGYRSSGVLRLTIFSSVSVQHLAPLAPRTTHFDPCYTFYLGRCSMLHVAPCAGDSTSEGTAGGLITS
eukprot:scaffold27518_cov66-Phaeocystis_antarctica.AAC.2